VSLLRRWLATNGAVGECSDWYLLLMEAKYLGVAPWDLQQQPIHWRLMAREALAAEHYAEAQQKQARGNRT
jgi:hypothetical protein